MEEKNSKQKTITNKEASRLRVYDSKNIITDEQTKVLRQWASKKLHDYEDIKKQAKETCLTHKATDFLSGVFLGYLANIGLRVVDAALNIEPTIIQPAVCMSVGTMIGYLNYRKHKNSHEQKMDLSIKKAENDMLNLMIK